MIIDSRREIVLQNWKASREGRQLELVFWKPPYRLDRRAKAYQKSVVMVDRAQLISARA